MYMIPAFGPQTICFSRLREPSEACIDMFFGGILTGDHRPFRGRLSPGSWSGQV